MWATGAGAASRRTLGTAVFGGMIAATVLAVVFVPAFFVAFQWLSERVRRTAPTYFGPGHIETVTPIETPGSP